LSSSSSSSFSTSLARTVPFDCLVPFTSTLSPFFSVLHAPPSNCVAALVATAVSLLPFQTTQVEVAQGLIAVDKFALFFKVIFLVAAIFTVLMSQRYLEIEGASPGEYYFLILCSTLGMMIMAGAIDLITAFIGLETMAVSFYILAGFIKPNQRSNEPAVKYFLLGAFSLGILLYGMSLLYGLSGTTNLRVMASVFAGQARVSVIGPGQCRVPVPPHPGVEGPVSRLDAVEVRGRKVVRAEVAAAQAGGHLMRVEAGQVASHRSVRLDPLVLNCRARPRLAARRSTGRRVPARRRGCPSPRDRV